eukprot:TRINITY_DN24474_c0_g1_i1.p1 TRINITY_DN24474_c0_g1~~TRINITY_DN24474_c0_g1_i1.p1  ORF type:complete len:496 (+),score=63.31 TRINITY_DN24474_c0_g1_i1:80-1567(+)
MIYYRSGRFGLCWKFFTCGGSVFPRAFCFAAPAAAVAVGWKVIFSMGGFYKDLYEEAASPGAFNLLWSGYTFVIGFLIVFRSTQAHSRFWEGAGDLNRCRAVWLNAFSNLLSFCSHAEQKQKQVRNFQQLLAKLMSMLLFESIREAAFEDVMPSMEWLGVDGIDTESLEYIQSVDNKSLVVLQWIQQLIIQADEDKVIKVAPPILSRVFQELSNGVIAMKQAQQLKEVPFPFAYSQLIACLLIVHTCLTPVLAAMVMPMHDAATMTFFLIGGLWSLQIIASEIDQPMGQDAGDLPFATDMQHFNEQLLLLMDPRSLQLPVYTEQRHVKRVSSHGDYSGGSQGSESASSSSQGAEATELGRKAVGIDPIVDPGEQITSRRPDVDAAAVNIEAPLREEAEVLHTTESHAVATDRAHTRGILITNLYLPGFSGGDTGMLKQDSDLAALKMAEARELAALGLGGNQEVTQTLFHDDHLGKGTLRTKVSELNLYSRKSKF